MTKRTIQIFLRYLPAVAFIGLWIAYMHMQARPSPDCPAKLSRLGDAIVQYANDNRDAFPPSAADLIVPGRMYVAQSYFRCPKADSRAVPPQSIATDGRMDYLYVYWPDGLKTPRDYPVMYDRRLSNHGGRGIYVLRIEEVVIRSREDRPEVMWDENATWLKKFAKEHPEFDIPLPDDLEDK